MFWHLYPEYDAFLLEHRDMTAVQIADAFIAQFGVVVTSDQVSGRLNRLGHAEAQPLVSTPQQRFDAATAAERARAADRALAREMASAVRKQAGWNDFLDIVKGELVRAPQPDFSPIVLPQASGEPEQFVQLISDIHAGKLVDPTVVGDSFGYNSAILASRFAELEARMWRLLTLHANTAPWSEIRIYDLGDAVDGVDMRRGHAHRLDTQSVVEQALAVARHEEELIRRLVPLGVPIRVIKENGNHGRVGDFGVNLPADNWDYVSGIFLKLGLRDVPSVEVDVTPLTYHLTQLGPYTTYSSHGHVVRGGEGFSGLPINGLARDAAKTTGLHRQMLDLILGGHWHSRQDIQLQLARLILNGAWDGGDDYSINQLKVASDPEQWAFGVHPRRGITWQSALQLAPKRLPTLVH